MVLYGTESLAARPQAYDLLAEAARLHWGLAPLPEVRRAEDGKPFFPQNPERQFNLSHSGSLALCALDGRPVGVDIQVVKALRPGLPGRVCAREELDWLEAETPEPRWERFARLWALKESRAKQSGRGLRGRIADIRVPLPGEGEELCALDGLWFRLYAGEGWRAAACGLVPPPERIIWIA